MNKLPNCRDAGNIVILYTADFSWLNTSKVDDLPLERILTKIRDKFSLLYSEWNAGGNIRNIDEYVRHVRVYVRTRMIEEFDDSTSL